MCALCHYFRTGKAKALKETRLHEDGKGAVFATSSSRRGSPWAKGAWAWVLGLWIRIYLDLKVKRLEERLRSTGCNFKINNSQLDKTVTGTRHGLQMPANVGGIEPGWTGLNRTGPEADWTTAT